jgi:hypothetical protein
VWAECRVLVCGTYRDHWTLSVSIFDKWDGYGILQLSECLIYLFIYLRVYKNAANISGCMVTNSRIGKEANMACCHLPEIFA